VLNKPLDVGESVDVILPIMELGDLTSSLVEVDVPETRLSLVKLGGPAEITLDAYAGKHFRGHVEEIGKRVNRSKATVPVKVAFADANTGALPDMSARVSFLTEALSDQALGGPSKRLLPPTALTKRDGKDAVFVVQSGKAKLVQVSVGGAGSDGVELLAGPEVGTRVVLAPPEALSDGNPVREGNE
jgi:HlyD family secretion protein